MRRWLSILIFGLCCVACNKPSNLQTEPSHPSIEGNKQGGRAFLSDFLDAIKTADRIEVLEHSSYMDAYYLEHYDSIKIKPTIYTKKELNQEQKNQLIQVLEQADTTTHDAVKACIFDPHHTIRFFKSNQESSSMEICFQCWELKWNGTENQPPTGMATALESFILAMGLQVKKDWVTKARQSAARAEIQPSTRSKPQN